MSNQHIRQQIAAALDGRTITQVAESANLSRTTLSRYIHGQQDLTTESLGRLVRALGITVKITG